MLEISNGRGANFEQIQTAEQFKEPEQAQPVSKMFPDLRFPDGRMMVWDYDKAEYKNAPNGYERNDVSPFVMGNVYVFPYPGDYYIPTDDELKRRKRHIDLQWWETMLWMRHLLRAMAVTGCVLATFWAIGYIIEAIKVFGTVGAPKVAAAFGDVLAVLVYVFFAAVAVLLFASFMKGAKDQIVKPIIPEKGPTMDQTISINIGGQQFQPGSDAAQKFTNNF